MKRAIIIAIFCFFIPLISGCIDIGNNETKNADILFTIWIRNKSNNTINGTINADYDDEQILTLDFQIDQNNFSTFEGKCNEGLVSIELNVYGQDLYNGNINVESSQNHHYFDIHDDRIEYLPPPG